jgi:Na+:H+ antiporter, NhaA family
MASTTRPTRLAAPVDPSRDHVLGGPSAQFTLVEYGSYACDYCHAAAEVVENLRRQFGDRLRYVYRHLPLTDRHMATRAAEMAEYASETGDRFWEVHEALMTRSAHFDEQDLARMAAELGLPPDDAREPEAESSARARVREDVSTGLDSGARVTPTFFINGRRYEGAWDESALAEALLGSVGHRLQAATLDFVRWAPSTGLLLLCSTLLAFVLSNSPVGPQFAAVWETPLGISVGGGGFTLSVLDWVNHGLLTVFFLVVGLEIKRELTIGRLASRSAAMLPIAAALGGIAAPALIYLGVAPGGPLSAGWGVVIATDTAFAVALIALLGDRVPTELRVFLTAAVIVDDLVAISIVALVYTEAVSLYYLAIAGLVVVPLLMAMNRWNVYRALPYAVLGLLLWFLLHEAGIHATLAGVVLAVVTPTRPPPNLRSLVAQAQMVLEADRSLGGEPGLRRGPSAPALRALDVVHDRIESPASKMLRTVEPWSSYFVLPVFALANAGLVVSSGIFDGHERLALAIFLGLVVGKPIGIFTAAWLAVRSSLARKPDAYTWRQLAGAGALAGIGFTMSLFIAAQSFPEPDDFRAAKAAIFLASLAAGVVGLLILWRRQGSWPTSSS